MVHVVPHRQALHPDSQSASHAGIDHSSTIGVSQMFGCMMHTHVLGCAAVNRLATSAYMLSMPFSAVLELANEVYDHRCMATLSASSPCGVVSLCSTQLSSYCYEACAGPDDALFCDTVPC